VATPRQAAQALKAFKDAVPVAVLRGLRKGLPLAVKLAKTKYMVRKDNRHPMRTFDPPEPPPGPLGIRQGNLVRSLRVGEMRYTGKRIIGTVEAGGKDVPYAGVHEFGAVIKARNGPNLVFFSNLGAGPFLVKTPMVRIPARPYLTPAVNEALPAVQEAIIREVRRVARVTLKGVARFN
jgi:phage gpG-like protein